MDRFLRVALSGWGVGCGDYIPNYGEHHSCDGRHRTGGDQMLPTSDDQQVTIALARADDHPEFLCPSASPLDFTTVLVSLSRH